MDTGSMMGIAGLLIGVAFVCGFFIGKRGERPSESHPAPVETGKLAGLRQNLRLKAGYDEALIDRWIAFERERLPNANMQIWMEAAIYRWERDNR